MNSNRTRFSRTINTGLCQQFLKFVDGVIGQLSDGWGENNPKWNSYWQNMTAEMEDGEVVIKMNAACPLYFKDESQVLEWFANNIKKTVKMSGVKWDRGNDQKIFGYFNEDWTVTEAYFAYEFLKGRDVEKHPEYEELLMLTSN